MPTFEVSYSNVATYRATVEAADAEAARELVEGTDEFYSTDDTYQTSNEWTTDEVAEIRD